MHLGYNAVVVACRFDPYCWMDSSDSAAESDASSDSEPREPAHKPDAPQPAMAAADFVDCTAV